MEELIKEYAQPILITMAGALLFVMLFVAWPMPDGTRGNVLNYMGGTVNKSLDVRKEQQKDSADSQNFDSYTAIDRPTAKTKKHAVEQTAVYVDALFLIKDGAGTEWNSATKAFAGSPGVVDVVSIKTSAGVELVEATDNAVWNRGTQVLCFPSPDSYMVTLRILDTNNVDATYTIPVAVDMQYPD